jgi:hypothetical protein
MEWLPFRSSAKPPDADKPMPQSEFEDSFTELAGKLEALEALLAAPDFTKHFEDLKLQIKVAIGAVVTVAGMVFAFVVLFYVGAKLGFRL